MRWGGLLVRHDPGRLPALVFSGLALVGLVLMLGVRRRRVFVRVEPGYAVAPAGERVASARKDLLPVGEDGESARGRHTGVVVAGLPKGTDPGLDGLVEEILAEVVTAAGGREVPGDDGTEKDDS